MARSFKVKSYFYKRLLFVKDASVTFYCADILHLSTEQNYFRLFATNSSFSVYFKLLSAGEMYNYYLRPSQLPFRCCFGGKKLFARDEHQSPEACFDQLSTELLTSV